MTTVVDDPASASAHVVHFYDDDAQLVSVTSAFLGEGLAAGDGALIVATAAHREAIRGELLADGHSLARLGELEGSQTLARIHGEEGVLEADRFVDVVGTAIARVARSSDTGHVRIYGEMVALLTERGDPAGAMFLEDLWNGLAGGERTFSLLCGYPSGSLTGRWLEAACVLHNGVLP